MVVWKRILEIQFHTIIFGGKYNECKETNSTNDFRRLRFK